MDPSLVELTRRLAAGDPTARAELAEHPGEMARALDEIVTVMERRTSLLAETEQYFEALAQQSLVGIYVAGRDRILYANETLATIAGYPVDEIVGRIILMEVVNPRTGPPSRETSSGASAARPFARASGSCAATAARSLSKPTAVAWSGGVNRWSSARS